MNTQRAFLLAGSLACSMAAASLGQDIPESNDRATLHVSNAPRDVELASFRIELLELGMSAATAIPVQPHIKDRSKMQALVVDTCFDLEQPQRALRYSERIENWRLGAALADYANYLVQHGYPSNVQHYLDRATSIANQNQDWRRDTIRAKIANVYLWLGQKKLVNEFEVNLVDSEIGKIDVTRAQLTDEESFEAQTEALDKLIETGVFEMIQNAHEAYAELFNRFYNDETKRTLCEEKIKNSWKRVPVGARVETIKRLARFSMDNKDTTKALGLIEEALAVVASVPWTPESEITYRAQLAAMRFEAGEKETAEREVAALLDFYTEKRDWILTVFRGAALRAIAESQLQLNLRDAALATYRKAMEESNSNPNGRPRAEDLCATCCSLARHGLEPDAELWTQLRTTHEGLSQPW